MSEETNSPMENEFIHRINCVYCNVKLHECNDEECNELKSAKIPTEAKDFSQDVIQHGVCTSELCLAKWQIDVWKNAFAKCKGDLEKSKTINSTFRILMLDPAKMEYLVQKGVIDPIIAPKEFANSRRFGWENLPPEVIQSFHEVFAEASKITFDILLKTGSKINLKKKLEDETAEKIKNRDKENKKPENNGAGRPKLSKYEKLVQDHMNRLNLKKEDAIAVLAKMGMTAETVK